MVNANFTWKKIHVISEIQYTEIRSEFTWIMYHIELAIDVYCQFYMTEGSYKIGNIYSQFYMVVANSIWLMSI